MRRSPRTSLLAAVFLIPFLLALPVFAEVRIIEAESSFAFDGTEGRDAARRIALLDAEDKALTQAASFAEGLAGVKASRLSRLEINAYTAGVVAIEVLADETRQAGERREAYIRIRSTLDTGDLLLAIGRYHQQADLEGQLESSFSERDALRKERAALLNRLARGRTQNQADKIRLKLNEVLRREETNREVHRLWTDLAFSLSEQDDQEREPGPEELERSATALEQAVRTDPRSQRAYCLLAGVYQKKGDPTAAEREARTAIQRNPSNPIPHLKLGILLQSRGRNADALKEFHFVERLRPHNPVMLYYMGMTLKDMKRCGLSVQYLQRFLKDKQLGLYPRKAEQARKAVNDCGGERGGYHNRGKI